MEQFFYWSGLFFWSSVLTVLALGLMGLASDSIGKKKATALVGLLEESVKKTEDEAKDENSEFALLAKAESVRSLRDFSKGFERGVNYAIQMIKKGQE